MIGIIDQGFFYVATCQRVLKIVFPALIQRFGEDLLGEAILITYKKIDSYDLHYCDKQGNPKPVKFVSYIWKRIDGFIIDSLKKEMLMFDTYDYSRQYCNVTTLASDF